MATLEEIRAKLQAAKNKNSVTSDAIFPVWNIPSQSTTIVRFLPDKNDANPFFWAERNIIKLPFDGILGDSNSKQIEVQVPCMKMWDEECAILKETRPWWDDDEMKPLAKTYYLKRSYIFNGLIVSTELVEDEPPESPIRRFIIGPQIFKIIEASLLDSDIEEIPTDYDNGLDFRVTKTTKGQYSDYSTSTWARKERALDQEERDAIQKHGLFNLTDFVPKKPTAEEQDIIFQMFKDSLAGLPYDPDKYGAYYKPYGFNGGNNQAAPQQNVSQDVVETVKEAASSNEEPVQEESAEKPVSANDILAQIRSRKTGE